MELAVCKDRNLLSEIHQAEWQENTCPASFIQKTIFWDHNLPLSVVGVVKAIFNYDNMSRSELERSDGNLAVKIDGGRGEGVKGVKSSIFTLYQILILNGLVY